MVLLKRMVFFGILGFLLLVTSMSAQQLRLKIGTNFTSLASSAAMEVESSTGGFLSPRMTQIQRDKILDPLEDY